MEVECSVIGNGEPEASVPGRDRPAAAADWYDYEAKYSRGGMELRRARAAARRRCARRCAGWPCDTFLRVGCAGLARVDFFVEGERVLVNELNTMPGFTADERVPEAVGGERACRSRSCATGCSARARALRAPSAAATRF